MGSIRPLPPELISQIAAGEVVERPASVVKELVENSLDAKASRIEVRVKKGGIERVEVVDNGLGIAREELPLALAHHATSKIEAIEDLFRIETFGFRGEALPSIASIARLTLISRPRGSETAWKIEAQGGQLSEIVPSPHPEGTRVVVEDLFYTVPARRKFLRKPRTEMGHITTWLHRFALAHFDVEFLLIEGRRRREHFPLSPPEERLAGIFGGDFVERAIAVELSEELFRLSGWLAPPGMEASSSEGVQQFWFVNRRPVREKRLYRALREAYELAGGRPGAAVLYLELPPEEVDVNVHPAKLEVRFRREQRLLERLVERLASQLRSTPPPSRTISLPPEVPLLEVPPRTSGWGRPRGERVAEAAALYEIAPPKESGFLVEGRYWIGQEGEELFLVDREAVLRELVRTPGLRPLPAPLCLELPSHVASLVEIAREALLPFGLEVERVGPETVSVRSLPAWLPESGAEEALGRLFSGLEELSEEALERWAAEAAAGVVPEGKLLQEARRLDREGGRLWCRLTGALLSRLLQP